MQHIVIENIVSFILFCIIQSFFINGVFECCKGACTEDYQKGKIYSGNIIYMLNPKWFENNKHKEWSRPLYSCVKCMSSVWGAITFWPTVIYLFGFHWVEVPVFVINVFVLVTLNWWVYKRL